ncbi:hypothetical protein FHG87_006229 [Trinorchestia longiramus]|nr:hypothetical protein FHG87_006229 [Trinorchestia longiramus]
MIRRPIKSHIKYNYDRKALEEFEKEDQVSYSTTVANWFSDVVHHARMKMAERTFDDEDEPDFQHKMKFPGVVSLKKFAILKVLTPVMR